MEILMSSSLNTGVFSLIFIVLSSLMSSRVVLGQPKQARVLKVITHNVWYGFTKKPQPRHGNWKQWMAHQSPDIVSLQELNSFSAKDLAEDAASWGHPYSEILKEGGFPTGITSRYPISHVHRIREGFHHGLLRCQIQNIWFYVIHFHPSNYRRRVEEAALLKQDIMSLSDDQPRIVLAGDFNGFSPTDKYHYDTERDLVPFFERLDSKNSSARNLNHGKIDYGGIEAIVHQGFIDVVIKQRTAKDLFVGTFPTNLVNDEDHGPDRRLDYIFVSPNLKKSVISAKILRDDMTEMLSDHIPVAAIIDLSNQ